MADNTVLPGTGEIYASDEIVGINHQRVKISVGAAGTAVDVSAAAPMPVVITDTGVDVSGSLVTIPHEHSKVHTGEFYSVGFYDNSVGNTASIEVLIVTGATTVHLYILAAAGGAAELRMFEDAITSADGTVLTPYNINRTSANVPTAVVTHTPTLTSDGTQLDSTEFFPGGTGPKSPGGLENAGVESLVLKASSKYLFRMTNISGNTHEMNLKYGFYEI